MGSVSTNGPPRRYGKPLTVEHPAHGTRRVTLELVIQGHRIVPINVGDHDAVY